MSVETMMTLGLAALLFVSALLVFGIVTFAARIATFVLRPAAREGYALARRHAPTLRAELWALWERTAAVTVAASGRFAAWAGPAARRALATARVHAHRFAEWLAPASRRLGASMAIASERAARRAAGAGRRFAASTDALGDRTVDGVTTYVAPAVRSLLGDDDGVVVEPTFVSRRRRVRHS